MELETFIKNFAEVFENTDASQIAPATEFKKLEEWSSLTALSVIAMVDGEYEVRIKGENLRELNTVEDLFNFVKAKI